MCSRLPSCDCRWRPIESASCTRRRRAALSAVSSGAQYKFGSWVVRAEHERSDSTGGNPSLLSLLPLACWGQLDQSPLSVSSCRSHSGSCIRSRKCQLSPHAPQTTIFPSASVWPPAVRRNSSLSRREAVCWQGRQAVRVIFVSKVLAFDGCSNKGDFQGSRE